MKNLYRRLTNKGYSVQQIDEILWRIAHRLPIKFDDQEEILNYLSEYVVWNMQQNNLL